ncbi:manganese efflux pump [Maricaulis sp.]|uniref:manganese efflux pump MntP n=1 Tax=Maricaulis sp. TaxID=1486257 RepID=UPI0025D4AA16|nr:manganese efflux pump [Maricaulis sp.]MDF1767370.1 manganese efflux pump [Maricaulis sp.]
MNAFALLATSLSLSTDAFAAALARGSAARETRTLAALRVGAVFGLAEGLMCLLGWSLALVMADFIMAVDHWIALVLLVTIGGLMIRNGLAAGGDDEAVAASPGLAATLVTALGTSIDAAAVGIALALALAGAPVWSALVIGLTSFAMAGLGYRIGPRVAERLGGGAEVAGGIVLIAIGVSIFISHVAGG